MMDENDELSQLEELLNADLDVTNVESEKSRTEFDIFDPSNNVGSSLPANSDQNSIIHKGDTDSSDDEEQKYCNQRKYDDYGTKVKKLLQNQLQEQCDRKLDFETRLRLANLEKPSVNNQITNNFKSPTNNSTNRNQLCAPETKGNLIRDVFTDPIFGIRIVKPLISSSSFLDRMQGREAVNMLRVKRYVLNDDLSKDWVLGGVIVRKSSTKQSQKGSQFLIWTLSDLKDDLKTVSLFLFRKAYKDLWKLSEGTVVAILNPNVLDRSQNTNDQACLSVEAPDKVMVLGHSKDFGICKSRKKNGEPCTSFVNINQCEHCIYHVKQEYQKYAKRQELQSSTMGKGLVSLQNKVLGKNTVIYGGRAYSALKSGDNKKVKDRDQNRLMSLSDYYNIEGNKLMVNRAPSGTAPLQQNSSILHSPALQKTSDLERLSKLSGSVSSSLKGNQSEPGTNIRNNSTASLSLSQRISTSPRLSNNFGLKGSGIIDLNVSYGQKAAERAKANAVKLIQQNGGIGKIDPNNTRGTEAGKKRALDKLNFSGDENNCKKSKVDDNTQLKKIKSERFKKILEATSAHQNLIEAHDDNEQEKYFHKLEKKEAMEEKMLNTFKLACKAVRCIKCKYTAFSAAQLCKDEGHKLKVLDTFRRFFKCADCGNRTVSLEIIPLHACSNCHGSKWEKTSMLREKKVTTLSEGLSIRGEEETFIGGTVTSGKNINLLVPEN